MISTRRTEFREITFTRLLLTALTATLGACGSSPQTCAPGGTYVPTLTRSASPGDCPAGVDVLQAGTIQISDNQACGPSQETFNGSEISGGYDVCSYHGKGTLTASASGISGTATITTNCWGDGSKSCTANYDIVYTRGGADGGSAGGSSGGSSDGGSAGGSSGGSSDGAATATGTGGAAGSPALGGGGTVGGGAGGGAGDRATAGTTGSAGTGGAGGAGTVGVLATGSGTLDVVGARYASSLGPVTTTAGSQLLVVSLQFDGSSGSVTLTQLQSVVTELRKAGVYLTDSSGTQYPFVDSATASGSVVEIPSPVPLTAGPDFQLIWPPNSPLGLTPRN